MPPTAVSPRDASPAPPRRVRLAVRLIAGSLFLLLFVVLGAVIAELLLEASYARTLYRDTQRHPPHPFLQVLPSSQVEHVNAAGFRGDEVSVEKPAGTFRIFAIGGSTTLGVSNSYTETYPYLLQTLLRERHPGVRIEVQNAGSAWYTIAHDLVAYQLRVRRFNPDVIIVFEAINDLSRSFSPPWWAKGDYQPDYSHYLGPYTRLTGPEVEFLHPHAGWLLWDVLDRWLHGDPRPFNQRDQDNVARLAASMKAIDQPAFKSYPSFREYYETLIHTIQADHRTLIVATQPFLYHAGLTPDEQRLLYFAPVMCADHGTYPSVAAMMRGMQLYNNAARDLAEANRTLFVDFEAAVPKTADYFSDDVHLRRAGNEILAKQAADLIDAEHLVERIVRPVSSPDTAGRRPR